MQTLQVFVYFLLALISNKSFSMLAVKASIRQEMKSRLLNVVKESVTSQSERVLGQLLSLPSVVESRTVCIYLSMQGEIDTYPIISKCLELGKVVYIPKVVGKQAEDMRMFHLQTFDQIGTFPKNKWGIPEPSISVINLEEETYLESIDVVFVPGVVFDSRCGRVGHGKGYYGRFLKLNFEFPLIWYFKIAF